MIEDFRLNLVFVNLKIVNECDIFLLVLPVTFQKISIIKKSQMSSFS